MILLALCLFPAALSASSHGPLLERSFDDGDGTSKNARIEIPKGYAETRTEHFLYVFPEKGRSRAGDLIERGEETRAELVSVIGVDPPGITRVYLAANGRDFVAMQPGGNKLPNWAAGVAYTSLNAVLLRQAGSKGQPIMLLRTFDHEMSHIILHRAIPGADIPKWFDEGLAQWQAKEFDFERIGRLSWNSVSGRLLPMSTLIHRFPISPSDVRLAYDQSYEFVNFLIGEYGKERFHAFIKRLGSGEPFSDALERNYETTVESLEKRWIKRLRMSYAWLPLITSGAGIWMFASIIFLLGYFRKRREKTRRMAEWEEDERDAFAELGRVDPLPSATDKPAPESDQPEKPEKPKEWIH